jgi:hypothetical protein
MHNETETRLEEWAALIGEELAEDTESVVGDRSEGSWRVDSTEDLSS